MNWCTGRRSARLNLGSINGGLPGGERHRALMTGLALALAASCLIALSMGRYSVNPADVLRVLRETLTGSPPLDEGMQTVLFAIQYRGRRSHVRWRTLCRSGIPGFQEPPGFAEPLEYRRARVGAATAIISEEAWL